MEYTGRHIEGRRKLQGLLLFTHRPAYGRLEIGSEDISRRREVTCNGGSVVVE